MKTFPGRMIQTVAVLAMCAPFLAAAQDSPGPKTEPEPKVLKTDADKKDFLGLRFGVGLSLTVDLGQQDRVESASVINGIVRVENENNAVARVMLESHYFFKPSRRFLWGVNPDGWGHGPFVALQPGTNEIIEAVALGWMWGFKRGNSADETTDSWNIGIGVVVDPNVQVFGDGLQPNQPLPAGETQIRYKEESQYGVLILTSFSF